MTTLKLLGAYRVRVAEEELRFITEHVTGSAERTRRELAGLALLEVEVRGADDEFDVGVLHPPGSDQVPYDERYFSLDGLRLFGAERPDVPDFRVCFFLHFLDVTQPIASPEGDLVPPELAETPQRLAELCIYKHPG